MSGSKWRRNYPILAPALSTILLIMFEDCVNEIVESAWASIGYFLIHFDPDIKKRNIKKTRPSSLKDFEKETICGLQTTCLDKNFVLKIYI